LSIIFHFLAQLLILYRIWAG